MLKRAVARGKNQQNVHFMPFSFPFITMKNILFLLLVAGLLAVAGCGAKQADESTSLEPSTNATDIAETATVQVDTAALLLADTTNAGSVINQ